MDSIELNARAIELRKLLGEDENSYMDVFSLASHISDLTLLLYPMGENISGICIKKKGANLIAVNSLMSYGRQRFSLAHEFYHLFFDKSKGCSISAKSFDNTNDIEKDADRFASYFLAPYNALRRTVKDIQGELCLQDIIKLEHQYGMSHQAMLWRLINDGYLKASDKESLESRVRFYAKRYGYEDKLYLPAEESMQKRTYGNYIKQAEKLKERDLITIGKYEELLIEAFRYDIVYGDEEIGGEIDD